jgi:enterobactin synthetase component F
LDTTSRASGAVFRKDSWPLAAAQHWQWHLQSLAGNMAHNSIAELVTITGALSEDTFRCAIEQLFTEVDAFRIRIIQDHKGIAQWLDPASQLHFKIIDASGFNNPQAYIRHWITTDLARGIDLYNDPLHLSVLFKLRSCNYAWYTRTHHIICDAHTQMLLMRRAAEIYTALENGHLPTLNPFGSISDLTVEETAYRSSSTFGVDRRFWIHEMASPPNVTTFTRNGSSPVRKVNKCIPFSSSIETRLRQLGKTMECSLPHVMFATIAAYLHRSTQVDDIVLGLTVKGRVGRRLRSIPGPMANTLPLRLSISKELTMRDLICQTRSRVQRALRHQRYLTADILSDLGRDMRITPLYLVSVNYLSFDCNFHFGSCRTKFENIADCHAHESGHNSSLNLLNSSSGSTQNDRVRFRFLDRLNGDPVRVEVTSREVVGVDVPQQKPTVWGGFSQMLEAVATEPAQNI